jgi:hypothetical protein
MLHPAKPADVREVVAHADEHLARLLEALDEQRTREDGVTGKMIGEHVFGGAHVLEGFDGPAGIENDDPIDEEEPHVVPLLCASQTGARHQAPAASRDTAASWPAM